MGDIIQDQEADIQPPRIGFIVVQSVDGTSRGYDLTKLQLQDESLGAAAGLTRNEVFFTMENKDSANVIFFAFDSQPVANAVSIDDTANNAVQSNGSIGFTANGCAPLQPLGSRDERVIRNTDKTLILKCASGKTAILVIEVTSKSLPGAAQGA